MFLRKCEDVMNSSDSFFVLDFYSYVETKKTLPSKNKNEQNKGALIEEIEDFQNGTGTKSEFWKQIQQEMRLRLAHFKSKDADLEEYITSGKFVNFEMNFHCRNYFILSAFPQVCSKKTKILFVRIAAHFH
ncbi:hypothetical protein MmiAt1_04060 [Methanimicrococcus sp. At1]|uniref:Uncharacterized protein n=1 Tax=Methanimicrococcus hacksteinii TaxID=3028293 RepID=A0ABU3VN96_9EURY|nr:hypothetical protein [Methanimicrococcus sp. At1]